MGIETEMLVPYTHAWTIGAVGFPPGDKIGQVRDRQQQSGDGTAGHVCQFVSTILA